MPTRSSAVTFWPRRVPSDSVNDHESMRWRSWNARMRAAATDSASRCAAGRPSSALFRSVAESSSAATLCALTWSNSAVYSSTAASPRARTSATIEATDVSMASSCAVSNAMSRASVASKSACDESTLRTWSGASTMRGLRCGLGVDGCADGVEQRLDVVALELQRCRVDDQPRADRHDVLDRDQVIGLERVAAADQVDDGVGETHQRRQLHRAVQFDQVDMHALGREVLACGGDVFGRHAQSRAALDDSCIVESALGGDHQPAAADAQVDRLIQAVTAMLEENVLAGAAQIGGTMLHVRRHVRCTHDDEADTGTIALD